MKAHSYKAGEAARLLGCQLTGPEDFTINGLAPLEEAGSDQMTFLANPRYRKLLESTTAGAIIVSPKENTPAGMVRLETPHPYQAFRRALEIFYPDRKPDVSPGIHATAQIDPSATIGESVSIGAFVEIRSGAKIGNGVVLFSGVYVGRDAEIGDDSVIGPNAVIRHEVKLGRRVVVADGTVIGFDGFGYAPEEGLFQKIPQVGTVEIADDVEIGANCCIDRATVGATRIGKGAKLDNLIQVAHGVQIGENTVIAAQAGISGSTRIGSGVMIGGQAGFVGHIELGDGMIVGAQAGVTKGWNTKGMVSGYPARPQMEAMRIEAALSELPSLLRRVKQLEKQLSEQNSNPQSDDQKSGRGI